MTLSESDVERCLDPRELLDGLEDGFRGLELGDVQSPPRPALTVPGKGFCLAMPSWRPGLQLTIKIVNVFDGNLAHDLPNHLALINLFDPDTGATTCVMDGTYITGIRTAASAVLSARLLSRASCRVATVIGAGVQGREHLRLLPLVRTLDRINVCSLRFEDAEKLAAHSDIARAVSDVESAVRESDIVCLATHSPVAVIEAHWVQPGAHVSSVGYYPPNGELPRASSADASPVRRDTRRLSTGAGRLWRARGPRRLDRDDVGRGGARKSARPRQRHRDHGLQGDGRRDGRHGGGQSRVSTSEAGGRRRRDGVVIDKESRALSDDGILNGERTRRASSRKAITMSAKQRIH